jgi:hypothetical protein
VEEQLLERIKVLEEKLDKVYLSSERTRKYLLWTLIGSIAVFVLPLVGLFFAIPKFISTLTSIVSL